MYMLSKIYFQKIIFFHKFQVGSVEIVSRIVDDLKDENEQYRKMVMETIENIMALMGAAEIDSRLRNN